MATHYKGQRITELLNIIGEMEAKLIVAREVDKDKVFDFRASHELATGYTALALAKAKLTALQGEDK